LPGGRPAEELHDGDALGNNGGGAALCFRALGQSEWA